MKSILSKLFGKKENIDIWELKIKSQLIRHRQFDPNVRVDAEGLSEKEKMDKGFNGKTYTINGIEYDF